jgi:hypothetical protein
MNTNKKYTLTVGWLYPELMSTYGDRGNIFVLKKRCLGRNINLNIKKIDHTTSVKELETCDMVFGGGAQDRQQTLVMNDLLRNKGEILKSMFADFVPGLFVCGSPQLLGHFYTTADGQILEGLGIFDMETKHFGKDRPRCIGNCVADIGETYRLPQLMYSSKIVGFENHGGRTYLGKNVQAFATVVHGSGNNGEDKTEGARYNNCIATYFHGPFLPKNPHIADWLIYQALKRTYQSDVSLEPLDDELEWKAHEAFLHKVHGD